MKDIEDRGDIELLLRSFYDSLFLVPGMKPVFEGIDMEKHLPNIVSFWAFVLLDEEGYRSNVFEKHLPLPIRSPQFEEWLTVFAATVDKLFAGEKAELAKQRAATLAFTFRTKWQKLKE